MRLGAPAARATVVALLFASIPCACHATPASDPPDQPASPQAKAEPAPIASPPTTSPSATPALASASAGAPFVAPPEPMRADQAPSPDPLPKEPAREGTKEASPPAVYTLTLALRSSDVAPPPKGVELSVPGVEAARRKSEPSLAVDLTPGHARAVLEDGFVLADGTELRTRADRYGYVVVAPDAASYRVGASGSLRAILGEGLFDVAPSSLAEVVARGEGARRLGRSTRRIDVTTRAAKGSFELARAPELGDSGVLVCRMLLDLMSAGPTTPVCVEGDVPLHVELRWSAQPTQAGTSGRIAGVSTFDAVSLLRRTDVLPSSFLTPPPNASFVRTGEPITGSHVFLTKADLAALRIAGTEPSHPGEGAAAVLSLHNSTDELRYVWLDGVPLAWLAPGGRLDVGGVPHARATVQWRTFLGDAIDSGQTVSLPTMVDALGGASGAGSPVTSGGSPPP
jgi:hypothetical protein